MHSYWKSFRYACDGLVYAIKTERNLKVFIVLYVLSLLFGLLLGVRFRDWEVLIFSGGVFLAIELMNTAIENFTDAFDLHSKKSYVSAMRATKDVAAGAALVCGAAWGFSILLVYLPYILSFIKTV